MFDTFKKLHDNRQSDGIPYYSFYDTDGNLIRGNISVTLDDNGQFDTVTADNEGTVTTYTKDQYTYTTECLYVLGIGFLIPGDVVKLKIDEFKKYVLQYGWHTNVSGQTIYSWYLVPVEQKDYYVDINDGIFQSTDLVDINIESKEILTFYKEFLTTIEVVEFRKDRNYFNIQ